MRRRLLRDLVLPAASARRGGLVLVGLVALGWTVAGTGVDGVAIDPAAILEHVRFLAADDLEGRGNGGVGLETAARYVAARFEAYGLEPAGDGGGFFQPFTLGLDARLGRGNRLRLVGIDGGEDLELHRDFEPMTFTASGRVAAPVVFAGYGIAAPEKGYDDYAGLDVRGKIVLVLRHVPRETSGSPPFDAAKGPARFVAKARAARARGAAALLLVNDARHHPAEPDELVRFGVELGADDAGLVAVHVRYRWAAALLRAAGRDLDAVQDAIDGDLRPSSFPLGVNAVVEVSVEKRRAEVRNVLGYLPPTRPAAEPEIVVVGAHYDHLGRGPRGSRARGASRRAVHNGADDNASGTAALLELARVLGARGERRRGILFAAFAGEEMGLLGSSHYVEHPRFPLERTVAMLNLDMVGRLGDGPLYVGATESSPVFADWLEAIAREEGLDVSFGFSGYGSSDHTGFLLHGVPAVFFFTGLHPDYHRPTDDWDRIDAVGIARVARVALRLLERLDAEPTRPVFVAIPPSYDRLPVGAAPRAYLGIVPATSTEGVRIVRVEPGGPAAARGLRPGDVLVALAGRPLDGVDGLLRVLDGLAPGEEVSVRFRRGGALLEWRIRLGRRDRRR